MVGSRRVSVEIGRQPIHNTACMDLGAFVNSAASQGIVFMNPSVFFPPGHEGSKSVSGVMVNTAVTHTAKITTEGCLRGETSEILEQIRTIQPCDVAPSQRCAGCILRLVNGVTMQETAVKQSNPENYM
jgi:hypothetical protein